MSERTPPHDAAAEQVLLGIAMLACTVPDELAELTEADFYLPAHATIWAAITHLHAAGEPTDPVAVIHQLTEAKELNGVGGPGYLHTCVAGVPTVANAGYYAGIVTDHARNRRAVVLGIRLQQAGQAGQDVTQLIADNALLGLDERRIWPEPLPLPEKQGLPVFPVDALPDWLGDYATAVAEFFQVPVDLPGSLALSVLSTAAGARVEIQVRPDWVEYVNIFTMTAMPAGSRKTPVFRALTAPLLAAEAALVEQGAPVREEAREQRRRAELDADRARAEADAASGIERDLLTQEAIEAALRVEEIVVPAKPILVEDDITSETAASRMAEQGGRLAVLAPEGGIVALMAGRYGGKPNFEVFLRGHGNDPLRVTRQNRREVIDKATLTVGLAVQPSILPELRGIPDAGGRGLLARFLYSLPPDNVGLRKVRDVPAIPPLLTEEYQHIIKTLTLSLAPLTDPLTVHLTDAANEAVFDLQEQAEKLLGDGQAWAHPMMREWASKWVGSCCVRIAGLLHVGTHFRDEKTGGINQNLTTDTLARAERIARYYADHALAAFDEMQTDSATAGAKHLLDWITRTHRTTFTRRDAHSDNRRRFYRVDDITPALKLLDQHGYIREYVRTAGTKGGRPSTSYLVNPAITRANPRPTTDAQVTNLRPA